MQDSGRTRREFMRALAAGSLALASAGARGSYAPEKKPNIIYILLDDAGYGDLSCYGQDRFETPNIDRLAGEGIRFESHYAGSAVCAPSRCSLMTGYHTGHATIRGNRSMEPEGQMPLPADAVTLPRLLKKAGYKNGMFGKWGLGPPGSSGDPMDQGFDKFFGYNCQSLAHNYYPEYLWHNRDKVMLHKEAYSHDLIMEKALEFIRQSSKGPFFCYLPVTIPHASLHVPEESARPFRKKFWMFEPVPGFYAGPVIMNPAACFAGMMTRLDSQVGELMALLKELGIEEDTLVMLTSDNGPHAEGGAVPWFFDSNGPFRGIKRDLYEGGIRVPMMARWPGVIKPGTVTGHVSAFWDVLPTLCDVSGIKAPEGTDGISMLPALLGREEGQEQHELLYWELSELGGRQAVRSGKWKAVRYLVSVNPRARLKLFDLEKDPEEKHDLAASFPDVARHMEGLLASARTPSKQFPLF